MTVGELLARISSSELTEWMAVYTLEADEARERELERLTRDGINQTLASPRRRR